MPIKRLTVITVTIGRKIKINFLYPTMQVLIYIDTYLRIRFVVFLIVKKSLLVNCYCVVSGKVLLNQQYTVIYIQECLITQQ